MTDYRLHFFSRRVSTAGTVCLLDDIDTTTEEADLIFSTSFYLDELNPVTACDLDPTTLNPPSHIHDDRNFIDRMLFSRPY